MSVTKYVRHAGFDEPVLIDASEFDPAVHTEIAEDAETEEATPKKRGRGKS